MDMRRWECSKCNLIIEQPHFVTAVGHNCPKVKSSPVTSMKPLDPKTEPEPEPRPVATEARLHRRMRRRGH